jgi:hypothetical protein
LKTNYNIFRATQLQPLQAAAKLYVMRLHYPANLMCSDAGGCVETTDVDAAASGKHQENKQKRPPAPLAARLQALSQVS